MKILNKILTIILALAVFGAGYMWEGKLTQQSFSKAFGKNQLMLQIPDGGEVKVKTNNDIKTFLGPKNVGLNLGDEVETNQTASIVFSNFGILRLGSETSLKLELINESKAEVEEVNNYVFKLNKGRIWANNLLTSSELNILVGGVYIVPQRSIVDINYDGEKVSLYANKHHALIGLVPLDYNVISFVGSGSNTNFINSFLLVEGNQVNIYDDQINQNSQTLSQLLYSKLLKEFQYGLIDELNLDDWVKNNISLDNAFLQSTIQNLTKKISERGLTDAGLDSINFQLKKNYENFSNSLIFDESKLITKVLNNIFDQIENAEYLLLFNRQTEADQRLTLFKKMLQENKLAFNEKFKAAFLQRLQTEYAKLFFVLPSDNLFKIKSLISDLLLQNMEKNDLGLAKKFLLAREYLNGAYDVVMVNPAAARSSMESYYKNWTMLLKQEQSRLLKVVNLIAQDNQIFDNLLRRYSAFYRDGYFAMKNNLEQSLLDLMPDGYFKNEEKQTVVSNKIDFLKRLQDFFLNDKVAVADARYIVLRLFKETDDLQLPADAQAAIADLFAQRLKDFGIFYRFLNSMEYVETTLHGNTHRQQFEEFMKVQQAVNIVDVKNEILNKDLTNVPKESESLALPSSNTQERDAGGLVDMLGGQSTLSPATQEVLSNNTQIETQVGTQEVEQKSKTKSGVCRSCSVK